MIFINFKYDYYFLNKGLILVAIEETIIARITSLLEESEKLKIGNEHGQIFNPQHEAECKGWLTAAFNIIQKVCSNSSDAYHSRMKAILEEHAGYNINENVGEGAAILKNIYIDINLGLISNLSDRVRAEVFDDFLDHAKEYLKEGNKNESGVIVGVVFEDTIRRLSRKNKLEEKGKKLDELISSLVKISILSQSKAKRARSAAHVRTKATHAQWDEFDLNDVQSAVTLTDELIQNYIDS